MAYDRALALVGNNAEATLLTARRDALSGGLIPAASRVARWD